MQNKIKFAFFGTPAFSVIVLDELKTHGFLPSLVITGEDKPKGRNLVITPPEVKIWAKENNIPYIQPKSLKNLDIINEIKSYSKDGFDIFIVASYGKIIPQAVLDIPKKQTLNVHPSLLPKLRGASPIKSAILTEDETGVTIMRLDKDLDHGPIVTQKKVEFEVWPEYAEEVEKTLGKEGGKLLVEILPKWVNGEIQEQEQNHGLATFCGKIEKSDGELDLSLSPEKNLRKIRAYHIWPTTYFFKNNKRIIVKRARIENGELVIEKIVPEGKKEMDYIEFLKNNTK